MSKISELLFPSRCVICDSAGSQFCKACNTSITRNFKAAEISGIKLSAGALYGDLLSQLILMAKEENISAARNVLVDLLVDAYVKLDVSGEVSNHLALIPIPSSRSANRKRGYRHSYLLARGARNRMHVSTNQKVEVVELLRVNRKISDMSALSREDRVTNIRGAYSITPLRREWIAQGKMVVLLDDLTTTGSSIGEAVRCLREAKIQPFAAISAGVSPHLIS